ncbi:MAG: acetyl-CoA acetyltransferase [Dehalococcoidia bacterium]|nr:acetyl-CoA acetyltransferase [Dehalococcoidia bacterium]
MAKGIKDKVAVVGFGTLRGGELFDKGTDDMLLESATVALDEAGLAVSDVQAAWIGSYYGGRGLSEALKSGYIPVTRVLNDSATGADAFRNACHAVAAGLYDIVMVAGAEKIKDEGVSYLPKGGELKGTGAEQEATRAAIAAAFATRFMYKHNHSYEELKRALGHIAVKSRLNATKNPLAYLQQAITLEEYMAAPPAAWPLGSYDCCTYVDGVAVAILANPETARQLKGRYALVKGVGAATSDGSMELAADHVSLPVSAIAARIAYEMAGVRDPAEEIDEFNVDDSYTIMELLCYESLGLCPPGQAGKQVLGGTFDAGGGLPVNTDGGLQCVGYPLGVSGLRILYEPYLQVTGQAGPRQLKNVRLAGGHAQGGADAWSAIVTVLGARD